MKFQNPSLNFFFNGRTNERTHGRTHKPKPICSPLFQSWGHNEQKFSITVRIIFMQPEPYVVIYIPSEFLMG